jgi:hypothetical protein
MYNVNDARVKTIITLLLIINKRVVIIMHYGSIYICYDNTKINELTLMLYLS